MLLTTPSTTGSMPQWIALGEPIHTLPVIHRLDVVDTTDTSPRLVSLVVRLSSLEPGYSLSQAINIKIQRVANDNFVASFAEANINASGESVHNAAKNLKSMLVDMFELLSSLSLSKLGPEPRKQLRVLEAVIRKNS